MGNFIFYHTIIWRLLLSYELAENSILLITIILALNIISKWLDIKKYQETWVRHYNHLYRLQKEMMRYLYGLDGI